MLELCNVQTLLLGAYLLVKFAFRLLVPIDFSFHDLVLTLAPRFSQIVEFFNLRVVHFDLAVFANSSVNPIFIGSAHARLV